MRTLGRGQWCQIFGVPLAITLVGAGICYAQVPSAPVYQTTYLDAVTGNNQFYSASDGKIHWYANYLPGADGSPAGVIRPDSYQNDVYERPTDQTFVNRVVTALPYSYSPTAYLSGLTPDTEKAAASTAYATDSGNFYEYVDITRGSAGASSGWMFFRIETFGHSQVDSAGSRVDKFAEGTFYTVRLGSNPDQNRPNGGIALRNQLSSSITTSWSANASSVKVFRDENGNVGGYNGVNFTKDDGDSMPSQDGYELDLGNSNWLYVRRNDGSFTGPGGTVTRPAIEFAFNYSAYNAANPGADFLPDTVTYLDFDATRGLQDEENYLWNDEYTLSEAGSPYPGLTPGAGTGNTYQLDTLRGGAIVPEPSAGLLGGLGLVLWMLRRPAQAKRKS